MSFMPPNQAQFEGSAAQTKEAEAKAANYARTHPDGQPKRHGIVHRLLNRFRRSSVDRADSEARPQ